MADQDQNRRRIWVSLDTRVAEERRAWDIYQRLGQGSRRSELIRDVLVQWLIAQAEALESPAPQTRRGRPPRAGRTVDVLPGMSAVPARPAPAAAQPPVAPPAAAPVAEPRSPAAPPAPSPEPSRDQEPVAPSAPVAPPVLADPDPVDDPPRRRQGQAGLRPLMWN